MKKNYEMPTAEIVEFENILEGSFVYPSEGADNDFSGNDLYN